METESDNNGVLMQLRDSEVILYEASGKPFRTSRPKTGELGATGTQFFAGFISGEEYNQKLQGQAGLKIYDEMRRSDAMVKATLLAIGLPIRQAVWRIEAASEDNKDQEIAELVQNNFFGGMSITWDDFLRQALLHLPFGYMMFEKVYKLENNKILLKKLAPRLPKTLYKWMTADDGGLEYIVQFVLKGGSYIYADIPIDRLLIFTSEKEGDNYEGISVLRSAYKHWYIKNELYKIDAIGHDRYHIGIPIIGLPEGSTDQEEDKKRAIELGKNLRGHEQAYIVKPFGFEIGLLPMPSKKGTDIMPSIQHHNEQIVVNILAQFLTLGTTKTGSRALGGSFQDLFLLSLQSVAKYIEDTLNRYCIKPLVDYNFITDNYPKLKASKIKETNFTSLADAVSKLTNVGVLTHDEELEDYVREIGSLPAKPKPKTQKAMEQRLDEAADLLSSAFVDGRKKALERDIKVFAAGGTPSSMTFEEMENFLHENQKLKESGYWRELNEPEKCLNLREIDNQIERTKTQLANKIKGVLAEQIDQLAKDVAAHPDTAKMKKQGKLTSLIKGELLDIYRYGRSQVKQEAEKQKKHPIRLAETPKIPKSQIAKLKPIRIDEDAIDFIDDKAYLVTRQMARRYENTALFAELEAKKLGLGKAATTSFITESLKALSDREAEQIAMHSVLEAFGIGRNVEAETRKEDIRTAYYSAIMDKNVCENCAPLDGKEHELDDPTYETPNPNCLGGNLCRCLTVYVMKSEALPSV